MSQIETALQNISSNAKARIKAESDKTYLIEFNEIKQKTIQKIDYENLKKSAEQGSFKQVIIKENHNSLEGKSVSNCNLMKQVSKFLNDLNYQGLKYSYSENYVNKTKADSIHKWQVSVLDSCQINASWHKSWLDRVLDN
jgi:hypothetical protein